MCLSARAVEEGLGASGPRSRLRKSIAHDGSLVQGVEIVAARLLAGAK
jgi:hypothetical protein